MFGLMSLGSAPWAGSLKSLPQVQGVAGLDAAPWQGALKTLSELEPKPIRVEKKSPSKGMMSLSLPALEVEKLTLPSLT